MCTLYMVMLKLCSFILIIYVEDRKKPLKVCKPVWVKIFKTLSNMFGL